MANTYVLIASNTLTSSAASVTFSSIPGTYTDLVLKFSARNNAAGNGISSFSVIYNGLTSNIYSWTSVYALTSTPASQQQANYSQLRGYVNQNGNTANTFSNTEIYIPNYAGSSNKVASLYGVAENNSTTDYLYAISAAAFLTRTTNAITSIEIGGLGNDFLTGSSFFLYGVKNT